MKILVGLLTAMLVALSATAASAQDYDLAILNGRVMDPDTGLDAVRNVGIKNGRIQAVTSERLRGKDTIDARGHVVAPGFIDFHVHGQDPFSQKVILRGGATSPLESLARSDGPRRPPSDPAS